MRELADTLERNLNFGSAVKKPAGGVSLHFQGTGDAQSQPQQMSGQRSSKQVWDIAILFLFNSLIFLCSHFISTSLHRQLQSIRFTSGRYERPDYTITYDTAGYEKPKNPCGEQRLETYPPNQCYATNPPGFKGFSCYKTLTITVTI